MHCMWRISPSKAIAQQHQKVCLLQRCGNCRKLFTKEDFTSHHQECGPRLGCTVGGCNKKYTTHSNLKEHLQLARKGAAKCWECDTIFATKAEAESPQIVRSDVAVVVRKSEFCHRSGRLIFESVPGRYAPVAMYQLSSLDTWNTLKTAMVANKSLKEVYV